ncbi:MAG: lipopolysaccharide biosynthesis protein [Oricola sp.]
MRFSAVETAEHWLSASLYQRVRPYARRLDGIWNGANETAIAQRMSLIAFAIRIVSAGIAFLSQVVMARWTGTFDYGIYVFVWTAMIILGNLSCLGFATAVIRFLPLYRKTGDLDRLRGILLTSRVFALVSASLVAAASLGIVWLLGDRIASYYVLPFVLAFTCLPMVALGDVLDGTARANSWPVRALTPTYIIRPFLVLVYMGIAHALGYEASAVTAVISAVLATYSTTIMQLLVVTRYLDAAYPKGGHRVEMGMWMAVAFPIFLVEGFFFLLTNADVLMVGFFMPPDEVGVYFATVKILALVHFVFFAVKAGVAPQFAARAGAEDRADLRAFARQTVGWTFWPSMLMGAAVLVFGKLLLLLFGAEFAAGYPLLFVLVAGVILRASIGPAESLLNMTGNQNICATIFGVVLAVNVALNLVLIPAYGLMGAAIANAGATIVEAGLLSFMAYRRIGVVMFVLAPKPAEAA